MPIDWEKVQQALFPLKGYEEVCQRLQTSFAYAFVRNSFNFSMPALVKYTQQLLGGDTRNRYTEYLTRLTGTLTALAQAGVVDIQDLIAKVATLDLLALFSHQSGIDALDVVTILKYLVYWVIPMEKYLSGLVRDDPKASDAIKSLREMGIRTNLDLLQQGMDPPGRKVLTQSSGLPEAVIADLVNRADFSRMPWASKATISNIMGAGYKNLSQLANANPEQVYADFFRYGQVIGKNLKLGNEIDNSCRIAKIIPPLVQNETFR